MKESTALYKAVELDAKAQSLLSPIGKKLAKILDDDCAHISLQPGDGAVVAYRGGIDNAAIAFTVGIDELLKLNKEDLLNELDRAGI